MAEKEKLTSDEKRRDWLRQIRYVAKHGKPRECALKLTNAEVLTLLSMLEAREIRLQSMQRWSETLQTILRLEPMPEDREAAMTEIYGEGVLNFYP